ncbi:zinc finger MYM-type protein 1-like [Physella acuta]|uniref:zinc finger MYM-type protein 1-like n=1 Tax=Physella acuta TaxID=109671 RepID=UPI0027DE328E|nr:zinc finger MYM-type protein 1-like [Physella acuta]
MERKPEKNKYSGWERKRLKEISDRQQSSSKCVKLDTYFSSCMPLTATTIQPEVDVSQDTQVQNVQATTSSNMQNQVVETQDNKVMSIDILEDTHLEEDIDSTMPVKLKAIIDINLEYPTDPFLFCETPVTPDLVRALLEFGPCQPGLKDTYKDFPKNGLAFRGHRESQGLGEATLNEGNFLELIKLISKKDDLLKQHLLFGDRNATYLSPDMLLNMETPSKDLSNFVSFLKLVQRFFFKTPLTAVTDLGLSMTMCYGQSYDGANTMSGEISGVQKRVREIAPHALFTHCCAHNLNLILLDAVLSNIQTQLFFGVLESIYTFFTGSLPRLSILQEEQRNNIEAFSLTLKRLSDTRWASRKTAVDSILQNLPALVLALRRIVDGEVKNSTSKQIAEGKGILVTIETFEFLVVLMFWKRILHKAFNVSIYLQKSSIDMLTAFRLIQIFENEMSSWRNEFESEFEQIENEATELAEKCDIRTEYKKHRCVFQVLLLRPKNLALDDSLIQLEQLAVTYSDVVDSVTEIVQEFVSFRTFYQEVFSVSSVNKGVSTEKEPLEIAVTVNSILKFMIANDLCSMYPNLATLYRIFLTLPISSAGVERSFSRLKLLKTYIRSTMNEDRLSSLALITIERQLASDVDLKDVIDHFAKMKPRRKRML